MTKPNPSQVDAARGLLAREAREGESAAARAAAGRRVFEKVVAHLGVLIGTGAARALFERCVKLAASELPGLAKVDSRDIDLGERIESSLRGMPVEEVDAALVAVFARLFALLGTMIGERLTEKVLRESWPAQGAAAPKEETK